MPSSMAEHALAMALAAAKRLILEHENLKLGQFNQFTRNRMLAGGLCGIFGFGGIGTATARLMHGIRMRVHAINRHGRTDERVDWIGTPDRLNELLEVADVLLISAPLTRATYGLIGAAELRRMKDDAILVNVARGEIVQERPLYDHLVRHPRFTACGTLRGEFHQASMHVSRPAERHRLTAQLGTGRRRARYQLAPRS